MQQVVQGEGQGIGYVLPESLYYFRTPSRKKTGFFLGTRKQEDFPWREPRTGKWEIR
ncbi:hypothetical protein LptCag_0195 [Leptospirillum ferriphilum]|uniref:Uncharacterized protein n=1 Tax=Leptospirillum ferriphilum TaxID=178606 RepID=A0A094WD65_9BACT|nr:hypothetical protein LptCag_0195 [Leptospirillum ferriphilum]